MTDNDNDNDQRADLDQLVVAARTDREAFGRLYEAYYERIFGYCLRRLTDRAATEDVVSDVFLFVARNMRKFAGTTEQDFRRWAYRIATTEVNAYLRQRRRRTELWDNVVDHAAAAADGRLRSLQTDDARDSARVYAAIAALPPREQSLVTLRLFEDMSHDEIARVLNIRKGAARTAYSRAIQKLATRLASASESASGAKPGV